MLQYRGVEVGYDLLGDRLHMVQAPGSELEIQDIGTPLNHLLKKREPPVFDFAP